MQADSKREAALKVLKTTGIAQSNYAPISHKLLWEIGLNPRPPHFSNFWNVALGYGFYFGTAWGALMWVVLWSSAGMSAKRGLVGSIVVGVLFGVAMAAYYRYSRLKHKLPDWSTFE